MSRSNTASSANWLSNGSAAITAAPLGMAIRAYLNNTTSFCNLMCLADANAGNYHALAAGGGGSHLFNLSTNDGGGEVQALCSASYSATTWYVVGCAVLGATERYCWMDGANEGTNTSSRSPTVTRTTVGGLRNEGSSQTFGPMDGALCEGAVWDLTNWGVDAATRKAAFLAALVSMARGLTPASFPLGRKAYWPLYGNDSPEIDRGQGAFPLTINGTMAKADQTVGIIYPSGMYMPETPAAGGPPPGGPVGTIFKSPIIRGPQFVGRF